MTVSNRFLHNIFLLITPLVAILFLSGCGGGAGEAGGLPKLRLDVVSVGTQAIPPKVIMDLKLDEKHGYKLDGRPNSGAWGAQWIALKSGQVDVVIASWLNIAAERHAGYDTTMIQPFMRLGNAMVVPTESGIQDWSQLTDAKVGIYNPQAPDWLLIQALYQKHFGFDPAEANQMTQGAPNLLEGLMEQGALDAAFTYGDVAVRMAATGNYRILGTADSILSQLEKPMQVPFVGYTATDEFVAENAEVLAAFLASYAEAIEILRTDDDIWVGLAKDLFDLDSPEAVDLLRSHSRSIIFDRVSENLSETTDYLYQLILPSIDRKLYQFDRVTPEVFTPVNN